MIHGTTTRDITAEEALEGDFILGLDNAHVIEVVIDPVVSIGTGLTHDLGRGKVLITANDAEGDELYLILATEHPLTVAREVGK